MIKVFLVFSVCLVKNLPASAGDIRDAPSVPGLGKSPGVGNGNPLWYSCLENSMDRAARQATVHRVTKSQTRLSGLSVHTRAHTHTHTCIFICLLFCFALGLCCCAQTYCYDFSCCTAQALGTQALVVAARGLSSCSLPALECGLSTCGAQT